MAKKYFLALNPILFDSIEDAASYINGMDTDVDLEGMVIGSLVGQLEKNTSFVIRKDNKIKRIKTKPPLTSAEPPPAPSVEEEEPEPKAALQCSFCHRPQVKTRIVDGLPTHLCQDHLSIEKELLNVGN